MILRIFVTIASVPLVCTQRIQGQYPPGKLTWQREDNGAEDKYMEFATDWKREIVKWAEGSVIEIRNKLFQLDQINWVAMEDLRHQAGITMGRILELHRQQMDMYRRIKRRFENRFHWIRPELAVKIPSMEVDGAVEPRPGYKPWGDFNYPWREVEPNRNDYKPHVYIVALEYITKRETDIEYLVKLITDFMGEEEMSRFKPHLLQGEHDAVKAWEGYSTSVIRTNPWVRQGNMENADEKKEEDLKAKMRADYYKRKGNNN